MYINFFFIQNLRVNRCCHENRQMLCRYSKCSVKAWKLWMLKDTCSCQSYAAIDPFSLFCEQIKFFWLSVISLVVHLAVCYRGVLFWILRWNEHGLLDNLVFYLKGTIWIIYKMSVKFSQNATFQLPFYVNMFKVFNTYFHGKEGCKIK